MTKRVIWWKLDENHNPVPTDINGAAEMYENGKAFESARRVGLTNIRKVRVSTVFLGIDHQFGDGPPLLFETMVFPKNENAKMGLWHDLDQERYSTWDEAEAGHARMVERARRGEWDRIHKPDWKDPRSVNHGD